MSVDGGSLLPSAAGRLSGHADASPSHSQTDINYRTANSVLRRFMAVSFLFASPLFSQRAPPLPPPI